MKSFSCDRCHREIDRESWHYTLRIVREDPGPREGYPTADLCGFCRSALDGFLSTPPAPAEVVDRIKPKLAAPLWNAAVRAQATEGSN